MKIAYDSVVRTDQRDPKRYTLWWVSDNQQASMWYGNYDTYEAAEADIPNARRECEEQLRDDEDLRGHWSIEEPTENAEFRSFCPSSRIPRP
jgi:hypothetical protein